MTRRSRAWADLQECRAALADAIQVHGEGSAEAEGTLTRYREAVERYRLALVNEFEDEVLDHMSRQQ